MQIQNPGLDYTPTHFRFISSTTVHILQLLLHTIHMKETVCSNLTGILFLRKKLLQLSEPSILDTFHVPNVYKWKYVIDGH